MIDNGQEEASGGAAFAFEAFAVACERLNEFARSLWNITSPSNVKTGTDIRVFNSGWKYEKYVEMNVNSNNGHVVGWILELTRSNHMWHICANINISYTDVQIELIEKSVESIGDLRLGLGEAVKLIECSLGVRQDLVETIVQLREAG